MWQHNEANEITDVDEEEGQPEWVTPGYDDAGNMTALPLAGTETTRLFAIYDAWNRLRKIYEDDGDGQFQPSDA